MIYSMTGYGKAESHCLIDNKKLVIEIRSLNSKSLDLSVRIAPQLRSKELEIRTLIGQRLERGKIDLSLYIEDAGSTAATRINQAIVENYKQQITDTCNALGMPIPDNMMEIILRMPETLKTEVSVLDENEWNVILNLLDQAFAQIEAFRIQEGQSLYNMFMSKINAIGTLLAEVEPYEGERLTKIKSRIEEGLKTLEEKITVDRNRLEQEMIFYIEKLDINEEKVRLRNHLNYFIETMDKEHAPGKKLGFIAQEMGREINTLGSKSNQSEMQIIVVKMKDILEQIKEQVLNVL